MEEQKLNNKETKLCPKCGTELPISAEYCTKCGAQQTAAEAVSQPPKQKLAISNWHWFLIIIGWICALMGFGHGFYSNAVLIGLIIGVYVDTHDSSKYGKYLWIGALIIFGIQILEGFFGVI